MEGRVFENFQKNQKKFQKSKHAQKRSQKCPNVFWRCFGVIFSKKLFAQCSMEGRVFENFPKPKTFQNSKNAQNRSQKCPNVFWRCFRVIFSKKKFAQFSMEGRVFEKFQKNQKSFKIPKMPEIVPKSVQTCFEQVLGWFFRKVFLPSVPWRVESSKTLKKIKKFQKSKHAQNRSQKCPNVFWSCFRVIFSKKFFAQCSMKGRVFENFQINQKSFKVPKMPKIVPKSVQTKIFQKIKKFSKFQKRPKSFPKVSKLVLKMF